MANDDEWRRRVPTIVQRLDFGREEEDCDEAHVNMDADSEEDECGRASAASAASNASAASATSASNSVYASRRLFGAPPSPPYKRVRALKLFDCPATPKTILNKCITPTPNKSRSRLQPPRFLYGSQVRLSAADRSLQETSSNDSSWISLEDGGSVSDSHKPSVWQEVNVNPFTPKAILQNKKKRTISKTLALPYKDDSMSISSPLDMSTDSDVSEQPTKKLRESNVPRYHEEFVEMELLGRGSFGSVHRCMNKMDGCVYALKKSLHPVTGSQGEKMAINEVHAHAVLGKHQNVVRYYSAWTEDHHMIIQNEYCDGGSLQDVLAKGPLTEPQLLILLLHVANGLKYIHSMSLVHMDIKPGNIFISHDSTDSLNEDDLDNHHDSADDGFDEHDDQPSQLSDVVYKIGDLGHVTFVTSPQLEEGDCRYLSKEVLQENLSNLTKADIFALGLTVFEAGGGGPLPKNGPEWQDIRNGKIADLPNCSTELNLLIKKMIDPDPNKRPSAAQILTHTLFCKSEKKSNADLRRELEAAKLKLEIVNKQLELVTKEQEQTRRFIKKLHGSPMIINNNNNDIGVKKTLKAKTRSTCGRLSPKQTLPSANNQKASSNLFARRQTRSNKFGRSNSNMNF